MLNSALIGAISQPLPDIPRMYTAVAEWSACVLYAPVAGRQHITHLKVRTVAILAAGLPVLILVHSFAGTLSLPFWTPMMLLIVGIMFAIIRLAPPLTSVEAGYFTARALVVAEFIASLHWQLTFYFLPTHAQGFDWRSFLVLLVVGGAILAMLALAERHHFPSDEDLGISRAALFYSIAIAAATFAMSNLSFVSLNTPFSARFGFEVFYVRTLVDLCGLVALWAQQQQIRSIRSRVELASIEASLKSQHEQYLLSKRNLEAVGRATHDLKHQITVLRSQLDPALTSEHFNQLEASVDSMSAQRDTGNPVLDVIVTTKAQFCAQHHITLSVVADGALLEQMESQDIATLFGNALDNAIEASLQVEDPEHRLVKFALFSRGNFTIVKVENWFEQPLHRRSNGLLRTSKKQEPHSHGIGLSSIRFTSRKYGGEATWRAADHWFTLTIMLPSRAAS